jgi:hypothetical protein
MDIRSFLFPRHATASERSRLSRQPRPLLDPRAQDYAAWRSRSLRLTCLAVVLFFALIARTGATFATVDLGLKNPTSLGARLEVGLSWYLRLLNGTYCLLLVAATWSWYRLRWSCLLARLAWVLAFFGPMPLFMIPYSRVLGQRGGAALVLASDVILGLLNIYVPALFALLPALIRASLALKRFLPEAALPGVLVLVATPLQTLVYVLLICILSQIAPHRELILGLLCLALAPMVWVVRAKALIKPVGAKEGKDPLWIEGLVSNGLALMGSSLILLEVSEEIDLGRWIGQVVDVMWVLRFMAGMLASRTILAVILVDGLLALLYHAHQAESAGAPAEAAESLRRKINSLGAALSGADHESTTFDG